MRDVGQPGLVDRLVERLLPLVFDARLVLINLPVDLGADACVAVVHARLVALNIYLARRRVSHLVNRVVLLPQLALDHVLGAGHSATQNGFTGAEPGINLVVHLVEVVLLKGIHLRIVAQHLRAGILFQSVMAARQSRVKCVTVRNARHVFASSGGRRLHPVAFAVESFRVLFEVTVGTGVLDDVFEVGRRLADRVVHAGVVVVLLNAGALPLFRDVVARVVAQHLLRSFLLLRRLMLPRVQRVRRIFRAHSP